MVVSIVVARYNEEIEWTKQFPNVIIYNKGSELQNTIPLQNVGREGHTYYKHICDNYHSLDEYTIFLQGNPFDHSPNVISKISKYINTPRLDVDFEFLSGLVYNCNLSGCPYHHGLPLVDTYEKLFGHRLNHMEFQFGAGAQFIVSRERILQRPIEFYQRIVDMLQNDINPIEGFVIERFHKLIFQPRDESRRRGTMPMAF
jgi:hypothetical protein